MTWDELKSKGEMWTDNDRYFYITKITDGYIIVMMYIENEDNFFTQIKIQADDILEDEEYWNGFERYSSKNNFVEMIFTADYITTDEERYVIS